MRYKSIRYSDMEVTSKSHQDHVSARLEQGMVISLPKWREVD